MSEFVLGNSVAMRWLYRSDKASDQSYAEAVLESMRPSAANAVLMPLLWYIEAVSVTVVVAKRGEVSDSEVEHFISFLGRLNHKKDLAAADHAFGAIIRLAQKYNLTGYDATYLELAIRKNLPLATLDQNLRKAAKRAGVELYLQH